MLTPTIRWCLALCLLFILVRPGVSFSLQVSCRQSPLQRSKNECRHYRDVSLFMEPFIDESLVSEPTPTSKAAAADHVVQDDNGNEIKVGSVVRVVGKGLKALQVPPKGYGSYDDETKEFVPDTSDNKEIARYLALPVGIRGTVKKVYDVEEISANFPVQVKFQPGKNTDEGYDPPVAFLMHFDPSEVECCL